MLTYSSATEYFSKRSTDKYITNHTSKYVTKEKIYRI